MKRFLPALLLLAAPAVQARPIVVDSPTDACRTAITATERSLAIADGLLAAIGRVESGRPDPATGTAGPWPWTINAEGVGHFYATKAEAIAAVAGLQARGVHSIDVGCVQVNLMYHPNAFATLDQAFDPTANAAYGGRFLRTLYSMRNNWAEAAAAYHSQTPMLGAAYRQRVMMQWTGRTGSTPAYNVKNADVYGVWPPPGMAYAAIPPASFSYRAFATPISTATPANRVLRRP